MEVNRVASSRVDVTESSGRRTPAQAVPDPAVRRARPEERPAEPERKSEANAEASKPVVNTSGQTTGTRINTSA